ncbi:MAG: 1-deoxy-D-xylulose-5-phosphate reductoisomerase [Rhodospirillales bacterium]|nr:1-deoxy-D-xylulose-5-phosphate reductoisomerase [Rhodospirillales bacterium]
MDAAPSSDTPRRVTILGSTGSIGCNTLDLIAREPDKYVVEAITGNRNAELLVEQALKFNPRMVAVASEDNYASVKSALSGTGIHVGAGEQSMVEAASRPADWVMAGIVGGAGLAPTIAAAKRGATVALANKECLVCAGDLLLSEVADSGATLLPVDSEHNAIFQVFNFSEPEKVERIILTASGGPFRETPLADMRDVTPEQAVAHPNWDMGAKISVDSATMMNKGLELIEARYLFPVEENQIEILVHPQSVIHSMVAYIDGSVLAQLGTPDMRTPISYALGWPHRIAAPSPRLRLEEIGRLTFEAPDFERFPALQLARDALRAGGDMPTILNAANEVAVELFLAGSLGFLHIARLVEATISAIPMSRPGTIGEVLDSDSRARTKARELAANF